MSIEIIVADIIEGLEKVEDKSIDLIFIDPPYNLGKKYANNIDDSWKSESEYINWVYSLYINFRFCLIFLKQYLTMNKPN